MDINAIGCSLEYGGANVYPWCRTHRRSSETCWMVIRALEDLALENRYPPPADPDSDEALALRQDALTV